MSTGPRLAPAGLALLLITTGVAAQSLDRNPADAAASDPDVMVCKPVARLGTKIAKSVCYTEAEWRKQEDETAAASRRFLDVQSERGSRQGGISTSQPGAP